MKNRFSMELLVKPKILYATFLFHIEDSTLDLVHGCTIYTIYYTWMGNFDIDCVIVNLFDNILLTKPLT